MENYKDTYRPQFHFSAPKNWLNDPNGLVYFEGEYHLFYQHNPFDNRWGPMYWGHAVSDDLMHWKNLPIALEPDELGTIFSGCCVVDEDDISGLFDGKPGLIAYYTSHKDIEGKHPVESQSLAYSKDKGRSWIKYAGNPILRAPDSPDAYDYRDPKVIYDKENKRWIMALGGGFYRFYKSDNLIDWKLMCETKIFEEFPDISMHEVDGKIYILVIEAGFRYFLGHFEGDRFIVDQPSLCADYSQGCQATQTYYGIKDNRTIAISWLRDGSRGPTENWRCAMSIPRVLSLKKMEDNSIRMIQTIVEEIRDIEEEIYKVEDKKINKGENILKDIKGKQLDIEIKASDLKDARTLDLKVFKSRAGRHALIRFDFENGLVFADYTGVLDPKYDDYQTSFPDYTSAMDIRIRGTCYNAPLNIKDSISFRVLIDRSTVEVFVADSDIVFSFCCYPSEDGQELELICDSDFKIDRLTVNKVESVW